MFGGWPAVAAWPGWPVRSGAVTCASDQHHPGGQDPRCADEPAPAGVAGTGLAPGVLVAAARPGSGDGPGGAVLVADRPDRPRGVALVGVRRPGPRHRCTGRCHRLSRLVAVASDVVV